MNVALETRHVETPADWADFFAVAQRIYHADPLWVSPLEPEIRRVLDVRRNPYFHHATLVLFLVYRDGLPAARASVVIDQQLSRPATGYFGFFECLDDPSVAKELFCVIDGFCLQHRVSSIRGPFNPNYFGEIGLQISGFGTAPSYFQPYNPVYYASLLEGVGFREVHRVCTASCRDFSKSIGTRFGFSAGPPRFSGYRVRGIKLLRLASEIEAIRTLFNDAFAENWSFQPLSREEYAFAARRSRLAAHRRLVSIVEQDGKPVAALACALNINPLIRTLDGQLSLLDRFHLRRQKSKIQHLMLFEVGIRQGHRGWPLGLILLHSLAHMAEGFDTLETTWMSHSDGPAARLARWAGFQEEKSFAIYEKEIL